MDTLRKTFRKWWQKPRRISDAQEDRRVSFLELFYDLAYVAIVAELTHSLVAHVSLESILIFIGLFAMVWLAWVNGSFYHELHGNNDIRTRIFTFLQMFALAGLAIFAHDALEAGRQGFALSYAFFLAIVTFLWWRTGVHDEEHRPMAQPYAIGFSVTTLMFIISAFTSLETALYLWGIGILFSLLLPVILISQQRALNPKHVDQAQRVRPSLVERFGLLTIIMLGEVVFGVVQGGSEIYSHTNGLGPLITVFLGLTIAFGMWWIYFDFVSHREPVQTQNKRFGWLYLHLPITMSIALMGAGVLYVLEHGDHLSNVGQYLITVPVFAFLLSIIAMIPNLNTKFRHKSALRKSIKLLIIATVMLVLISLFDFSPIALLIIVNLILLLPILGAVRYWIRRMAKEV